MRLNNERFYLKQKELENFDFKLYLFYYRDTINNIVLDWYLKNNDVSIFKSVKLEELEFETSDFY